MPPVVRPGIRKEVTEHIRTSQRTRYQGRESTCSVMVLLCEELILLHPATRHTTATPGVYCTTLCPQVTLIYRTSQIEKTSGQRQVAKSIMPYRIVQHHQGILLPPYRPQTLLNWLKSGMVQLTDYHAKYFAHELTKRCASDSIEKLAGALMDAQVDLNPHQVEAALFAFKSPLSKGAILADEVGLGKTIEAGLVLSQRWAERKRRLLAITPANLRKQWYQELQEKFFLPCRILEAKSYNAAIKQGHCQPFHVEDIIICSYQFARSKAADIRATHWDLVVIDEAHRLRNVY